LIRLVLQFGVANTQAWDLPLVRTRIWEASSLCSGWLVKHLCICIVAFATSTCTGADLDTVTVRLDDGRILTAEIHERTNPKRLWLRFTEPSITLISSVRWEKVVRASYQEQTYTPQELWRVIERPLAEYSAPKVTEQRSLGQATTTRRRFH